MTPTAALLSARAMADAESDPGIAVRADRLVRLCREWSRDPAWLGGAARAVCDGGRWLPAMAERELRPFLDGVNTTAVAGLLALEGPVHRASQTAWIGDTVPTAVLEAVFVSYLRGGALALRCGRSARRLAGSVVAALGGSGWRGVLVDWPRDAEGLGRSLVAGADDVTLYASDETLAVVRTWDGGDRVRGFGTRGSFVWLDHTPDDGAVSAIARDVAAWEQVGCMAPHLVLFEGSAIAGRRLGERLVAAAGALPDLLPASVVSRETTERCYLWRQRWQFSGEMLESPSLTVVWSDEPCALDDAMHGPGGRHLLLLPRHAVLHTGSARVSSVALLPGSPAPHWVDAPRICALGALQRPRFDRLHDGRRRMD